MEEFFGEVQQKPFSYKSKEVSSLFYFTYSDFSQVLKKYPEQLEVYCFLRDSIQFSKDYSKISKACLSCRRFNHPLQDCPYLFYGTNQTKIIHKYQREIELKISKFERKSINKSNSLQLQSYIKMKAQEFLMCNEENSYFSINSQDFGSELQFQDDTFLLNRSLNNIILNSINPNLPILEEQSEISQPPSSLIQKLPSQLQMIQSQQYNNLLSIKDSYKNNKTNTTDSQKQDIENTLSPNHQKSNQYLNIRELNDRHLYYSTQNIIKTLDLDVESIRRQLKPSSAVYIENIPQCDEASQNNQSQTNQQNTNPPQNIQTSIQTQSQTTQKRGSQQLKQQNSTSNYIQSQNNIPSIINILKLPLSKGNGNLNKSIKEKICSTEQVPMNASMSSIKKQFIKIESVQQDHSPGNQNLLFQMINQSTSEIKDLIVHMFSYFQHQDLYGSKKIDLKKKMLESNQQPHPKQLLGDLNLDLMQSYKIYFPQFNIERILYRTKIKAAVSNLKYNQISRINTPLLTPSANKVRVNSYYCDNH